MTRRQISVLILLSAAALAVFALPLPSGTGGTVPFAISLTVLTIGLWATGTLPEHVTAIGFFILAMIFSIAPATVVFSGFHSNAFWLLFGGMIIGAAADQTGLGRYLGHAFMRRIAGSYTQLISGIVLSTILLAFLIPTALGRLMLLMPIVLGLADQLGFKAGSRGRTGMIVALSLGSYFIPATILPANIPNAVVAGAADTFFGIKITYGLYLLMHFPITGAVKAIVMTGLIVLLFPDKIASQKKQAAERPRLDPQGKRLAWVLIVTLITWATDFLHGVSPGWVAAAAGLVCIFPGIGVVPPEKFRNSINLEALLFVAGILGLGAVVAHSGGGKLVADGLMSVTNFTPESPAYAYSVFSGISMVMGMFATLPGMIVVLAPFAQDVANASGLPLVTVMMLLVNGFTTLFFPYQAAPIVVGLRLGGASIGSAIRVMLPMAIITLLVLFPLNFWYWRLLGYLP